MIGGVKRKGHGEKREEREGGEGRGGRGAAGGGTGGTGGPQEQNAGGVPDTAEPDREK